MTVPVTPAGYNPEAAKLRDYPLFDWLRFLLASAVQISHSGFDIAPNVGGSFAVSVFFALSGWLIGGILLRTASDELPRFYFNRATRIWIPYAFAVLLIYGLGAVRDGVDFFWFKYLLLDVTFTHNIFTVFPAAAQEMPLEGTGNHFWSISVEEQFYLFAPLIILFLRGGRSALSWAVIAALMMALRSHYAPIALGVTAACLAKDYRLFDRPLALWLAVAVVVGLLPLQIAGMIAWIVTPLLSVAIVIACAWPGRRTRLALIAGGISYPLYLHQWIGGYAVAFIAKHGLAPRGILLPAELTAAGSYLVSVGVALVAWWLVDRVVLRQRQGWYTPQIGRTIAVTAYALCIVGLIGGTALYVLGRHASPPPPFFDFMLSGIK